MRIAGLLMVVVATFAKAQQLGPHQVYSIGSGAVSCGKWLEEREYKSLREQRRQWLLGYASASNYTNASRQVQLQDGESALAFVDHYCSNNPLHFVPLAAAVLVEALGGPKAAHPWKR